MTPLSVRDHHNNGSDITEWASRSTFKYSLKPQLDMPPDESRSAPRPARRSISAGDERTPLLATSNAYPVAGSEEEPALLDEVVANGDHRTKTNDTAPTAAGSDMQSDGVDDDDDDQPLPKLQVAILSYARLVEPIAFFAIFPFVNQMLEETGNLAKADVGFYSGLIVRDAPSLSVSSFLCLMRISFPSFRCAVNDRDVPIY